MCGWAPAGAMPAGVIGAMFAISELKTVSPEWMESSLTAIEIDSYQRFYSLGFGRFLLIGIQRRVVVIAVNAHIVQHGQRIGCQHG